LAESVAELEMTKNQSEEKQPLAEKRVGGGVTAKVLSAIIVVLVRVIQGRRVV